MVLSYKNISVPDGEWVISGYTPTRVEYTVVKATQDEQQIDITFIETHDRNLALNLMKQDDMQFRLALTEAPGGSGNFYTYPPLKPPGPPIYHRATEFTFIGRAVDEDVDLYQIKLESYV